MTVYPCVCGGTHAAGNLNCSFLGLSLRVQGNLAYDD